ncbi:DmpA family aminopeptidase [Bacillus niameyensis]|uniref:DmpA family aminopeptidase n=1 Tax=Bacillus niameyensis TaxID=1522308 RepID=UPI0007807CCA|nr:P1 family peptidase [Bacillus niameyensis]
MRKRYRELGLTIGMLPTGKKNCITDVPDVRVGHETLKNGMAGDDYVCTGVTAILPHGGNVFQEKVIGTSYVFNGFGKTTGLVQLNELGRLESPIMLTNTFAVPQVTQGALEYLLEHNPEIGDTTGTVNVVVGECNDSYLNSIRTFPVTARHALSAIEQASTEKVEEGSVGAGAGMVCCGFKGGIGTSSRIITVEGTAYTVGCLVLSNFGKKEDLFHYHSINWEDTIETVGLEEEEQSDGSIMIVLATDAPVNERQLNRIAKRCGIGLGRTGSHMAHGSGDIVIAFSTAQTFPHHSQSSIEEVKQLREDHPVMTELFQAAAETTNEAILNSLTMAETTTGRKNREVECLPYDLFGNSPH